MSDQDHQARLERTYGKPAATATEPAAQPTEQEQRIARTYGPRPEKPAAPTPSPGEVEQAQRVAKTYGLKPPEAPALPQQAIAPAAALKLPEGFDAKAPEFTEFSKTIEGLEPAVAQKVFDRWHADGKAFDAQVEGWKKATREDAEIGGQNLDTSVKSAKGLVAEFGNDAFRDLVAGPMGNHPEVVRFLAKVSGALRKARGPR